MFCGVHCVGADGLPDCCSNCVDAVRAHRVRHRFDGLAYCLDREGNRVRGDIRAGGSDGRRRSSRNAGRDGRVYRGRQDIGGLGSLWPCPQDVHVRGDEPAELGQRCRAEDGA